MKASEFEEYQKSLSRTSAEGYEEGEDEGGSEEWFRDQILEVKDTYDKWLLARVFNIVKLKGGG